MGIVLVLLFAGGVRYLPWIVTIEMWAFATFLLYRRVPSDGRGVLGGLLTVVGKSILAVFGYVAFSVVTFLLVTARRDAKIYGRTLTYITKLNAQTTAYIYRMDPLKSSLIHRMLSNTALTALAIMLLLGAGISGLGLRVLHDRPVPGRGWMFWHWLIRRVPSPPMVDGCVTKDSYLLGRLARTVRVSPVHVLVPGELILVAGADATLMPHVSTLYPKVLLFLIQAYLVQTGVIRFIAYHFSSVFKFEDDVRHIDLFTLAAVPKEQVFRGKAHWLIAVSSRLSPIPLALLTLDFAWYMRADALFLIPIAVVVWLGISRMVRMVMKVDFHVFAMLYATRQQLPVQSIRDFMGYRLIQASDTAVHRGFMLLSTMVLMGVTFIGLIHGIQWAEVGGVYLVGLAGVVFVSSKGVPDATLTADGRSGLDQYSEGEGTIELDTSR